MKKLASSLHLAAAALLCLWLLLQVCLGATDLQSEQHRLGLD